ncbi:hypothetical protein [Streptomyces sp. NPDC059009]|uniref:hypothetical protein n=1 Tax=Streptomyces sp. NPDC059009 TaxID=3346694 RepID=UPI0036D17356
MTSGPAQSRTARLLPWQTADGKSCFLSTDGTGYVSRLADNVESVQLGMGADLLGHAADLLDNPKTGAGELHFLAARLTEALRDVLRVAESRGARLPRPDADLDGTDDGPDADADDYLDGDGDGPQLPAEAFG